MQAIEVEDIQGLVRSAYARHAASYQLLTIENPATTRTWLAGLLAGKWIGRVADTVDFSLDRIVDDRKAAIAAIAFTPWGLKKLGLSDGALRTFVSEFQEGIAAPHRARLLGDERASEVGRWDWGKGRQEDILLIVYAPEARLAESLDEIEKIGGKPPPAHRPFQGLFRSSEPFGFADGVSQPFVDGISKGAPAGQERRIRPGEFVLGYPNEIGQYPATPSVDASEDPQRLLPRLPASDRGDLGRNGSFLVLRQLEQNVEVFRNFVGDDALRGARMVGRWKNGAPLVLHQTNPGEVYVVVENDFNYHRQDRHGFRCPIGAHIRRANPRDSLADGAGVTPERAREMADQHRILRRGRVYRENGAEGLLFLCLNTNIERQFEFIQNSWLMHLEFGGLQCETDPLLGNLPTEGTRAMTIQHPRLSERIGGLGQFVTVKGGGYFFLPGLKAIQYLSQLGAPAGPQPAAAAAPPPGGGGGRSGDY